MAKALGMTPEEEHRLGLSKLAAVREQNVFLINRRLNSEIANKRTSGTFVYGYGTTGSDRMVC